MTESADTINERREQNSVVNQQGSVPITKSLCVKKWIFFQILSKKSVTKNDSCQVGTSCAFGHLRRVVFATFQNVFFRRSGRRMIYKIRNVVSRTYLSVKCGTHGGQAIKHNGFQLSIWTIARTIMFLIFYSYYFQIILLWTNLLPSFNVLRIFATSHLCIRLPHAGAFS